MLNLVHFKNVSMIGDYRSYFCKRGNKMSKKCPSKECPNEKCYLAKKCEHRKRIRKGIQKGCPMTGPGDNIYVYG